MLSLNIELNGLVDSRPLWSCISELHLRGGEAVSLGEMICPEEDDRCETECEQRLENHHEFHRDNQDKCEVNGAF